MKGEVVYLYAFDVAAEIQTQRIREILSEKPLPFDFQVDSAVPKDFKAYRPLALAFRDIEPRALSGSGPARIGVRIYDVGVVSVVIRVPFTASRLSSLLPFHHLKFEGGHGRDEEAQALCQKVCEAIRPHMIKPSSSPVLPEAYTVFCITSVSGPSPTFQWLDDEGPQIAALLGDEAKPGRLSPSQVKETLRVRYSQGPGDLAVIDWDAALVVDLGGYVEDFLYVLEIANLQLEEFKLLDSRLDKYLDRAYDDADRYYRRPPLVGGPGRILRSLRRIRVDLTQLMDQTGNITKFLGDWYLARVYLGARDRFHLADWQDSVQRKLGQLDRLYEIIRAEVSERRMLVLEILIVVLFVVDIALYLSGRK